MPSKLKCDLCKKFKTSYTLDYARHRDAHRLASLGCAKCSLAIATPSEYAAHLEAHHTGDLMSTATAAVPEQQPVPAAGVEHGGHEEDNVVIEANLGSALDDERMLESFFEKDKEAGKVSHTRQV